MSDANRTDAAEMGLPQALDGNPATAALRAAGADQFDPVSLHYLERLALRAQVQPGSVKRILEVRWAQALAAFSARFEQAQSDAQRISATALPPAVQTASLAGLVRQLAQPASRDEGARSEGATAARPELKTVQHFRNTWSKLSTDKQLTQALDRAPKNAGPINSHALVLRSLALMRDISPDYLNRFMTYVDTLQCLDQCSQDKQAATKAEAAAESSKKMKARRSRAR